MLLRSLLLSLCFVLLCGPEGKAYVGSSDVIKISFAVQHSRALDLFMVMDNVTNWRPGWNQSEYGEYWSGRFGTLSVEDRKWIDEYAGFRRRTFKDPDEGVADTTGGPDGIFVKRSSLFAAVDPLALHFRTASDVNQTLSTLPNSFGEKDGRMLQGLLCSLSY